MLDAGGNRLDVDLVGAVELQPGQRIVSVSAGGGGYGSPLERDPEQVRHDVLEGWVSRQRAEDVYGVVLTDGEDGGLKVDVDATADRRTTTGG